MYCNVILILTTYGSPRGSKARKAKVAPQPKKTKAKRPYRGKHASGVPLAWAAIPAKYITEYIKGKQTPNRAGTLARAALEQAKTTMKGTRVTKHAREELAKWLDGFATYIVSHISRGKTVQQALASYVDTHQQYCIV